MASTRIENWQVLRTLRVLLAAGERRVRRVVFAPYSSMYGASKGLPKREDQPTVPISPYGVNKLAAEGYCRSSRRSTASRP